MILIDDIPEITGVTCDSREVKPGYCFVAITGLNNDGNKYITEAVKKGAIVIFTEKESESKEKVPIIRVKDARQTLSQLAASFYNYPSKKLDLIGVTGTNGKTTTTHLIYHLLNYQILKRSGLIGTVKVDTGHRTYPGDLTTPPPVQLQKYLREMVDNHLQYACMEVSSHGIKLKRIGETQFTIKIGTNISMEHFDLHPDFPDYLNAKKSFLDDESCHLVLINRDDHYLSSLAKKDLNNRLYYAIQADAQIRAEGIKTVNFGVDFIYNLKRPFKNKKGAIIYPCQIPVKMKLFGEHNIYNALAAITVGLYAGISPEQIQQFFRKFKGVWRRLEVIYQNDFTVIDDCAHNPGSYRAVFDAVKKIEYRKLFIINSLRGNRGSEINRENARTISNYLPGLGNVHLITSNCRDIVKPIDLVSKEEEKVFLDTLRENNIKFEHFQELDPALRLTLKKIAKNNLILLLGPHAMDHVGERLLNMIHSGSQ
jgi:UDP-N-acetylmuramoyl-L-alanyl-D-glutamate--2,6-diaminopimelate ligase